MRNKNETKKRPKDKSTEPPLQVVDAKKVSYGQKHPGYSLDEFTKVLKHIHETAKLIDRNNIPVDQSYQKVVNLLPNGCRYSDIACARIAIDGKEFKTKNYSETEWRLCSGIKIRGSIVGTVEICYLEKRPDVDKGPFSIAEQHWIDIIGQQLGRAAKSRRQRKQLWESREKLTSVFELTSDAIMVTNLSGIISEVNDRVLKMTGYDRGEELNGRSILELTAPQDYRDAMVNLRKALKERAPRSTEYYFRRTDGSEFLGRITLNVLTDISGNSVGFLFIIDDITRHKRLEYLEYALAERVRELECLNGITYLTERPHLTMDELYQGVANLLPASSGYPRIDCVRVTIDDKEFKTENYKETEWKLSSDIWIQGAKSGVVEVNYTDPDIKKEPFLSDAEAYFESVTDRLGKITEYMHEEEALRDSEEFRSSLLQNSPNPVIVLNPDTSIRYVNPALERLTGFSSSEITGMKAPYPWWTDDSPDEKCGHLYSRMRKGARGVERLYKTKTGEQFWVEMTFVPMEDNGELKYCLSSWIERTEQRLLKENLNFYVMQVTKAQEEERKRIALELHDDTIQVLFSLLNDVNEIISDREKLPGRDIRQLEQLKTKIDGIMDQVRHFTHQLRPHLLDEAGLIPALESLIEEGMTSRELKCRMEVIGRGRRLTSETELSLFRIVQEALRNIRKHSEATEAVIRIEFTIKQIKLHITDNGCGFKLPKVMSGFVHSGKLGLMGMYERTYLLNGSLTINSEVGKGTTVAVEIPLVTR